jgi:hypothetical protein
VCDKIENITLPDNIINALDKNEFNADIAKELDELLAMNLSENKKRV